MSNCDGNWLGTAILTVERLIPAGETLVAERRGDEFFIRDAMWLPQRLTLWPHISTRPLASACSILEVAIGGRRQFAAPWWVVPADHWGVPLDIRWEAIDPETGIQFTIRAPTGARFVAQIECVLYRKSEKT